MRGFRIFAPADFPRLQEIHLETGVAVAAFVIAVIAAVLCGVAPAFSASKADLNATVKEKTPATAPSRGFSLRSFLVITEVALAMVLLTGSALMVQSLVRLLKVDTGLHTANLVTAQLTLSSTRYHSDEQRQLFNARLFDVLHGRPEFSGVALSNNSILEHNTALINFDPSVLGSNEKATNLEARSVSPGYFETLGIPVLRGRAFTQHDIAGAPQVVLINESLRRKFFTGRDPLGEVIKFSPHSKDQYQIVGVVADTRDISLGAKPRPQIYFPLLQDSDNEVNMMVRSSLDAAAVTRVLQQSVWSVDKDEPLRKIRSMSQVIAGSVAEPRFRTWLLGTFAVAGLALTLIGIYGVISYSVAQRTNEMGIRIALGAQPLHVLGLVLNQGVRLTLAGATAGLIGSLLLTRLLQSQLYDIKANDPATLLGAALAMLLVAMAASYIPARRATRVDPMVALRYE
jgi:putative ABC transport system permease protein